MKLPGCTPARTAALSRLCLWPAAAAALCALTRPIEYSISRCLAARRSTIGLSGSRRDSQCSSGPAHMWTHAEHCSCKLKVCASTSLELPVIQHWPVRRPGWQGTAKAAAALRSNAACRLGQETVPACCCTLSPRRDAGALQSTSALKGQCVAGRPCSHRCSLQAT